MSKEQIKDKELYFLIAILGFILIYQLIKMSSMVHYFPLRGFVDGTSYMGRLFLLANYGYHNIAPNWSNGCPVLTHYAPGWFFLTLPIYWLTNSIEISTFVSMIFGYLLSLGFFIFLRKWYKLSLLKSVAFFLMFYLSPTAFSNFFDLGRLTDLISFTIFIFGFGLIIKKRKFDIKWLTGFIIIYSLLILNQSTVTIFFSFLVLGLILGTNWGNSVKICLSILFSLLLTSFFWITFLDSKGTVLETFEVMSFSNFFSYGSIISIIFLISFFFYWFDRNKNKKELLFYLPSLILVILYGTRLVAFIPFLNKIWPNSYNLFFTFLAIFLILRTKFNLKIKKIIRIGLFVVPLLSLSLFFIYPTYSYEHNDIDEEIISILPDINERVLIVSSGESYVSTRSLLVYSTIYYDITTPDGWSCFGASGDLYQQVKYVKSIVGEGNCEEIRQNFKELEIKQVVAISDACRILNKCGYDVIIKKEHVCLIDI